MASRESCKAEVGECLATDCYQPYEFGSIDDGPNVHNELYKSVAVNETSVTGNEDSSEEFKSAAPRENPENGDTGEVGSGADTVEFEEDWSQKWILIENSL